MKKLDIIYTKKNEEKSNRPDIFKAVTKYNLKKEHQYLKKKTKKNRIVNISDIENAQKQTCE